MKYLLIITMLLTILGCEDNSFDSSSENEQSTTKIKVDKRDIRLKSRNFSAKEVEYSCNQGCLYQYQLFKTAKSLNTKSVSLNMNQLNSILSTCTKFCSSTIFSKINKSLVEGPKKQTDREDAVENEDNDDEETPFEDL